MRNQDKKRMLTATVIIGFICIIMVVLEMCIRDSGYAALQSYDWPGNVRELENTVHRIVVSSKENMISGLDIESGGLRNPCSFVWIFEPIYFYIKFKMVPGASHQEPFCLQSEKKLRLLFYFFLAHPYWPMIY